MAISRSVRDRIFGPPGKVDRITVTTPWGIRVVVHRLVAEVFLAACREAHDKVTWWRPRRIDSFNARPIRGTEDDREPKWSMHAYALAWDFFVTGPGVSPPGGVWTPQHPVPPEFAECFTRRGFRWGAEFDRVDLPHIEWPSGLPEHVATPAKPTPPTETSPTTPHPPVLEDFMADPHGTARMLFRIYLGRNPNDQRELDLHVVALVAAGLNQRCADLSASPEGKAWEAKLRAA